MQANQNVAHQAEIEDAGHPDSLFGICQSIGEHIGFNPLYLRLSLFVLMLFNPIAMACAYAALGMVVGLSHLMFPQPEQNPWKADAASESEHGEFGRELMAA
jgi:phage shock protein C